MRHHHDRRAGRPHQRAEQAEHLGASYKSSAPVGSSAKTTLGEPISARADRDALLLPAGELPGPRPALVGQPDLVERCRYGRPPRGVPDSRSGSATLSAAALSSGKRLNNWKTNPIARAVSGPGPAPVDS